MYMYVYFLTKHSKSTNIICLSSRRSITHVTTSLMSKSGPTCLVFLKIIRTYYLFASSCLSQSLSISLFNSLHRLLSGNQSPRKTRAQLLSAHDLPPQNQRSLPLFLPGGDPTRFHPLAPACLTQIGIPSEPSRAPSPLSINKWLHLCPRVPICCACISSPFSSTQHTASSTAEYVHLSEAERTDGRADLLRLHLFSFLLNPSHRFIFMSPSSRTGHASGCCQARV